ncbi:MAG: hypothetical protein KBE16_05945 [Alphaproteobacteria bacterium]|nr:hypothetical protein [Alphaproteobacteria bacterium]
MTLVQFQEAQTLKENQKLYYFPDSILEEFHAFKVTDETTNILERKKDQSDYLGLFSCFDERAWKNLLLYLNPRDVFKMVVTTRNMNGLYSINQLRNWFVYIRANRARLPEHPLPRYGQRTAHSALQTNFINFSSMNRQTQTFQTGFPELKLPLLTLFDAGHRDLTVITTFQQSVAGGLAAVCYDPQLANGSVDLLGGGRGHRAMNPVPDLNALVRLALSCTMVDRNVLELYIQKLPYIRYLGLTECVFDESWGGFWDDQTTWKQAGFSAGISIDSLESLNLAYSKIHPFALLTFLQVTRNLEQLEISGIEELAHMDFAPFSKISLPNLITLVNKMGLLWSLSHLRSLLEIAPNLTALNVSSSKVQEGSFKDFVLQFTQAIEQWPYYFPEMSKLDISESPITWSDLAVLFRMMPNLTELDIRKCKELSKSHESVVLRPMEKLKTLHFTTAGMDAFAIFALKALLDKAPNLQYFPLDFDFKYREELGDDPFEEDISNFCFLAVRGYKIIQDALEAYMDRVPERRKMIKKELKSQIEALKRLEDIDKNLQKRNLEDGDEPSSKRVAFSDHGKR